jgi:hypothetical protein
VTLRPCYRATCDVPGCSAVEYFDPEIVAAACRARLVDLGWAVIPWHVRPESSGAPRISYMCPEHRDLRPAGWREARESAIRRIARERQPHPINLDRVSPPMVHIDATRRAAMLWMLVEQTGTQLAVARAAGVTRQWVSSQVAEYKVIIERRAAGAARWQEPWAQRLRAAGAIR